MLKVQKIHHQYLPKGEQTLKNVSFDLHAGQLLAIVGETGSGKTTLLKILSGLIAPIQGWVELNGEKLEDPREQLIPGHPQIALVAQDFQLFPHHTVYDNLEYQLRKHKAESIDKRIRELLRFFDLGKHKNKKPSQLSGGQQQKVALAKALSHRPKVLLMDEPFAHLDFIQTQSYKKEIKRLITELDLAVILVTHTIQDALSIADEIIILQKGKMLQMAAPRELYTKPKDSYIAQLTGHINLLKGSELQTILSKKILNKIPSFSGEITYGIRPQHIRLTQGKKAKIHQIEFEGMFYLISIVTRSGIVLKVISTQNNWSIGESLGFEVEAEFCVALKPK